MFGWSLVLYQVNHLLLTPTSFNLVVDALNIADVNIRWLLGNPSIRSHHRLFEHFKPDPYKIHCSCLNTQKAELNRIKNGGSFSNESELRHFNIFGIILAIFKNPSKISLPIWLTHPLPTSRNSLITFRKYTSLFPDSRHTHASTSAFPDDLLNFTLWVSMLVIRPGMIC